MKMEKTPYMRCLLFFCILATMNLATANRKCVYAGHFTCVNWFWLKTVGQSIGYCVSNDKEDGFCEYYMFRGCRCVTAGGVQPHQSLLDVGRND